MGSLCWLVDRCLEHVDGCVFAAHVVFVFLIAAQEIEVLVTILDGVSDVMAQQDNTRTDRAIIL